MFQIPIGINLSQIECERCGGLYCPHTDPCLRVLNSTTSNAIEACKACSDEGLNLWKGGYDDYDYRCHVDSTYELHIDLLS